MTFDPSKFVAPTAKPIPVVLLLDISYSMSGAPIDQLNKAVREMITSFSSSETSEIEIQLSVITFGAEVKLHTPYTSATDIEWEDLSVNGATPMGTALKMAKAMIEDKEVTPSRAYRPTIVLVSDGGPTDDWESPLNEFIQEGRSSKCDRMAVAIGDGAERSVLNRFIEGCEYPLFTPDNASDIRDSFRYITMSVTARSKSQNPNKVVKVSAQAEQKATEYEDDELF
ncbi:VWA domain-containing protein [Pseudoalteromonas sp. CnMc7-37]|uniref:vWA domain-containing protein n=1 Tax=Pseudoalteromonas sp. CnMc7-37 TaxID=2954496 RepID=UPI002098153B|nr:VWA domain-containing protein [Pseudoalteromonas sp. CnMc7-37]MCO7205338.1 VWA domain-containing protein [Pseudoalteromonas sp. CnMc7-37]